MRIDFDSIKPIYAQVAEAIEDDIIIGRLEEGEAVYSQLVLSRELGINPATAAKGINQLVNKGILEKQRGLSMSVAFGARERLFIERRDTVLWQAADDLVNQACKIGLSKEILINKITELFENHERGKSHE